MAEPFPKTLPRSTLACPPAKNFLDNYKQNHAPQIQPQPQPQLLSSKPSTAHIVKKESEKEIVLKSSVKDIQKSKGEATESERPLKIDPPLKIAPPKETPALQSEIHVKKWVDYSTKYGLGYLLSDGCTGVYFNDSTKIIVDRNGENFEYIEKRQGEKSDTITAYKLSDYPPERELQKKVTLLQHFKNYLHADFKPETGVAPSSAGYCYVKKWMKTKHAIMFRLSNKIVQVNFTDKTEIILSSEQKLVTYINLKG